MQSAQSPLWAAHNWGRLICVVRWRARACVCVCLCDAAPPGFTHHQRGNAAIVLLERQYTERWRDRGCMTLSFFFPWMFSPSTLCLCRPELFILHKEKRNAKGYKDNQNGESLAWDTQTTPTHTHTHPLPHLGASPPTHAREQECLHTGDTCKHTCAHPRKLQGWMESSKRRSLGGEMQKGRGGLMFLQEEGD